MNLQNPTFQVVLPGLDLNDAQIKELETILRKSTIEYLQKDKAGKSYLSGLAEYKPDPNGPWPIGPWPWPGPFPRQDFGRFRPRPFPGFFPINRKALEEQLVNIIR